MDPHRLRHLYTFWHWEFGCAKFISDELRAIPYDGVKYAYLHSRACHDVSTSHMHSFLCNLLIFGFFQTRDVNYGFFRNKKFIMHLLALGMYDTMTRKSIIAHLKQTKFDSLHANLLLYTLSTSKHLNDDLYMENNLFGVTAEMLRVKLVNKLSFELTFY